MRHLLYLLLIINLAYLGWNLLDANSDEADNVAIPALPESVRPLVLLREAHTSGDVDTADVREMPGHAQDAADAGSVPEPSASPSGESLQLPLPDAALSPGQVMAANPPGAGLSIETCQVLGPFARQPEVTAVASELASLGVRAHARTDSVQQADGYWVYMLSKDRAAAQSVAGMLDAHGDHDHFIGRDNTLSFGIFQDESLAQARARQMQALGLEVILEPRYRTQDAFWLELDRQPDATRQLAGIMRTKPELQLLARACL